MYVCMYVYIYLQSITYIHMHVCMYVCIYLQSITYIHMHVCMYVCMYVCIYLQSTSALHKTFQRAYIHTYIHIHTHQQAPTFNLRMPPSTRPSSARPPVYTTASMRAQTSSGPRNATGGDGELRGQTSNMATPRSVHPARKLVSASPQTNAGSRTQTQNKSQLHVTYAL